MASNLGNKSVATWARTVFYKRQKGVQIDLVSYATFLAENPYYPSIDERLVETLYSAKARLLETNAALPADFSRLLASAVAEGPLVTTAEPIPIWQQQAPLQELQADHIPPAAGDGEDDKAPYPDKFAKLVEAIQSGKDVEGIRQIPDTVVHLPVCSPG